MLKFLDERGFDIEDRDKTIERWITIHSELETELAQRSIEERLIAEVKDKLTSGDLNGAEKLLKNSFEKNLKLASENGKLAAADAFELGIIKELQLDHNGAKKFIEQAVQLDREDTNYLNKYGKILELLGKHMEAAENYYNAWGIDRKIYGDQHPNVEKDYKNLERAWHNLDNSRKTNGWFEDPLPPYGQPYTQMKKVDFEAIKSDLETIKKKSRTPKISKKHSPCF